MQQAGTIQRFYVSSPALGGRHQPVDVYLPPGYASSPRRRYPVFYLLHGVPGRPGAFLQTVRLGVVEDVLLARHRIRPMILVMPFGSTGSFTDKEWANGIRPNEGWETFLSRDVVRAVDARYRTIRGGGARALGGLSEGGYGALNIGIHHPGRFVCSKAGPGTSTRTTWLDLRPSEGSAALEQPCARVARPRRRATGAPNVLLALYGERRPAPRPERLLCGGARAGGAAASLLQPPRWAQLGLVARSGGERDARRVEASRPCIGSPAFVSS